MKASSELVFKRRSDLAFLDLLFFFLDDFVFMD